VKVFWIFNWATWNFSFSKETTWVRVVAILESFYKANRGNALVNMKFSNVSSSFLPFTYSEYCLDFFPNFSRNNKAHNFIPSKGHFFEIFGELHIIPLQKNCSVCQFIEYWSIPPNPCFHNEFNDCEIGSLKIRCRPTSLHQCPRHNLLLPRFFFFNPFFPY